MERKKLFNFIFVLVIGIFIVNALATKFYWYSSVWYFDIIMHFIGGFWVGLLALYFHTSGRMTLALALKALGAVVIIGIGWEIFEAFVDKAISANPFNVLDTAADLLFDVSGGASAVFYYLRKLRRYGQIS